MTDDSASDVAWERDAEHFPVAVPALMADYVERAVSAGWAAAYVARDLPYRPRYGVIDGFAHYAFEGLPTGPGEPSAGEILAQRNRAAAASVDRRWYSDFRPRLRTIYGRLDAITPAELPGPALAAAWQEAWYSAVEVWTIHFTVDGPAYRALADLIELWASLPESPADGDATRVLRARPGGMLALQRDLAALERLARGSMVPWAVAAENDVVRRTLRDFIARHGRLGQAYIDLRVPDWSEQPGQLIDVIARRLEGPAAKETFDVRTARLNREADEHWRQARLSVPTAAERLRLDDTVRRARRAAWLTQEHCYWIDQMHVALMRRLALAVGARLRATGCIDEIDDVFFLHASEVTRLLRRPARRRSMVGERHAQLSAQERSGSSPAPVDAVYRRVLKGEPGSPGIGRGPARLIRVPEDLDAVRPGDVLVCQGSNPSWVPFMAMAGALVAESGGPLSHAAIIARELGIPAVVGVAGAMIGLRDGQPVEVDGRAGTVRPV